jgi:hypothetical protein
MKTFFLTLVAVFSLASVSFGQDNTNTATSQSKSQLVTAKETGIFSFVLPEAITNEDVVKNSKFYVHYFTTEFNDKTKEVKIKMIENNELNRHIMVRFLVSCGIQYIILEGNSFLTQEYFQSFII